MGIKKGTLWTATILLSVIFVASGASKLLGSDFATDGFEGWGYPLWFMVLVGLGETAGAIFILLPRYTLLGVSMRFWGATILVAVMMGAVGTHIVHDEYDLLLVPLALLLMSGVLAVRDRPSLDRKKAASLREGTP